MHKIIRINAGGRTFQTYLSTLLKYPDTRFAQQFAPLVAPAAMHQVPASDATASIPSSPPAASHESLHASASSHAPGEVFLDVNPDVFDNVLNFLRTSQMELPTANAGLRAQIVHHLNHWDLMPYAFPPLAASSEDVQQSAEGRETEGGEGDEDGEAVITLPDVCVVQLCDHMQHDQGVKRHAMTITYGADGFQLRGLTQDIRRDLNLQLSSTYWQCYQTSERAAFFATTKVANGAADILTTSITQQVIAHTERMGYHLVSSYVALSPDIVHTSVRMLIHNLIFRRTRLPVLEESDYGAVMRGEMEDGEDVTYEETYQNFEPRPVGPQRTQFADTPSMPSAEDLMDDLWTEKGESPREK